MREITCVAVFILTLAALGGPAAVAKPNILFLTVDDMSADSIGAFGCKVKETSPNVDRLASEGVRFKYAHVQTAACMPSRNAMLSGRYPHNNRVEGFYQVRDVSYPVMADLMRAGGYFVAIRHKVGHSTPYSPYKWDLVLDQSTDGGARLHAKDPASYGASTRQGIAAARAANKPFCLNINVADPHKPFYAEGRRGVTVDDPHAPSRVFKPDEILVPGFLPDDPVVRKELAHYYSSVRRADDAVGHVLKALEESGETNNTVVIFLADHGMPLPFAKTQLYHHSTRTPWIVRWPGVTKAGVIEERHMIEGVDVLPTLLDIAGIEQPTGGVDGRSIVPLLKGEPQDRRKMVFKEHNENSGGHRNPMRAVETRTHLYIFNAWANGTRRMGTATNGTNTYRRMTELAPSDPQIAARLKLADHRVPEELYDVARDPDCLHNLIDDPASRAELDRLRAELEAWMKRTNDPLLESFQKRDDPAVREAYVRKLETESAERRGGNADGGRRGRRAAEAEAGD
jgi:N-sulfoglucosamine sulfohydrolase